MLLNKPRAMEVMDKHKIDGLVAVNQVNVYYLTDYWGPLMRMRRSFYNYAVLPRDENAPAALIVTAVEMIRFHETPELTWVPNICAYTHPITLGSRDYDPDVEEPEASQEGARYRVRTEALRDDDRAYLDFTERYKGSYSVNPTYALKKAIIDAGLASARVGCDDPRVIGWLNGMGLPNLTGIDATTIFREIRMVKTEPEIAHLRKAAAMNEAAVNKCIASLHVGLEQTDLEQVYNVEIAKQGGRPVYLSCGHMGKRRGIIEQDKIVTFDGLCEYQYYHGDIGRIAICGNPTDEMRNRAAALKFGCDVAYDMIKPGVKGKDLTKTVLDAVRKKGFEGFSICTPHSVGLEHTDHPLPIGPQLPGSQGEFVFQENMVFTLDMPYYEVGWGNLHCEDTVRVTKTGIEPFNSLDVSLRVLPPGGLPRAAE